MKSVILSVPGAVLGFILLVTCLAPLLPLLDPIAMNVGQRFAQPSVGHLLGQDEYGRDLLARIVFAMRSALFISGSSAVIAGLVGSTLGVIAGYTRGMTEALSMRSMDVILCFPPLLLAMLAVTFYGPGALTLIPVLAVVFVPSFARVAHASVLVVRAQEYVEATRSMGASRSWIMFRTILPNIVGSLIVQFSFVVVMSVVLESGLSFLGLGVVPPTPSLGLMIGSGRATLSHEPLLLIWPCLALSILILVLNAFCDRLRDHFDPRHGTTQGAKLQ